MAGSTGKELISRRRLLPARLIPAGLLGAAVLLSLSLSPAAADDLTTMSVERWAKLREAERFQMLRADDTFKEKNWKVAQSEYHKFLTLYERSEGASYAQLRWALCLIHLRQHNTAIRDGFQSLLDYWPDSPEAVSAAYFIGSTYRDIGEVRKAKAALRTVLVEHPKHLAAVYAMKDLLALASAEKDTKTELEILRKLAFEVDRTRDTTSICNTACQQLARDQLANGELDEAVEAIARIYPEQAQQLPQVVAYATTAIRSLSSKDDTKVAGNKLADLAVSHVRKQIPGDTTAEADLALARLAWFSMANLYAAAGRDSDVQQTYDQMFKAIGKDDEVLGEVAAWHTGAKRYDQARQIYRQFMDKNLGLSKVADVYRAENPKSPDAAVAVYKQLLGQDPENVFKWKADIAATYRAAEKYREAAEYYLQLMNEDLAKADDWRWHVGLAYRDARDYKQAIGYFNQCTNMPANIMQMAHCYRQLKQHGEALLRYRQVITGYESSAPEAQLQTGYTFEEAGQKENAIKSFQTVCRLYPKMGQASTAHRRLQDVYKISVTLGGAKQTD